MLMLAWTSAGCGNAAGFVSQTDNTDDGSAVTEASEQEQPEEEAQTEEAASPAETSTADAEEISINDIGPIAIGQTENAEAGTGCTVFISKEGMPAGLDCTRGRSCFARVRAS